MRADRLRLLDALEQIEFITQFTHTGREAFFNDALIQSAVLHRLALLGESCRGLSSALREAHPGVPWPQIIALRNVLIHEYFGVDLELVWAIVAGPDCATGQATSLRSGFVGRLIHGYTRPALRMPSRSITKRWSAP